MIKLKPCGKCGEEPELKCGFVNSPNVLYKIWYQYKHSCYKDGKFSDVHTHRCSTLEQAREDWNK